MPHTHHEAEFVYQEDSGHNVFRGGTITQGFDALDDKEYLLQRYKYYGEHPQAKTMSFEEHLVSLDNIINTHAARKATREAPASSPATLRSPVQDPREASTPCIISNGQGEDDSQGDENTRSDDGGQQQSSALSFEDFASSSQFLGASSRKRKAPHIQPAASSSCKKRRGSAFLRGPLSSSAGEPGPVDKDFAAARRAERFRTDTAIKFEAAFRKIAEPRERRLNRPRASKKSSYSDDLTNAPMKREATGEWESESESKVDRESDVDREIVLAQAQIAKNPPGPFNTGKDMTQTNLKMTRGNNPLLKGKGVPWTANAIRIFNSQNHHGDRAQGDARREY